MCEDALQNPHDSVWRAYRNYPPAGDLWANGAQSQAPRFTANTHDARSTKIGRPWLWHFTRHQPLLISAKPRRVSHGGSRPSTMPKQMSAHTPFPRLKPAPTHSQTHGPSTSVAGILRRSLGAACPQSRGHLVVWRSAPRRGSSRAKLRPDVQQPCVLPGTRRVSSATCLAPTPCAPGCYRDLVPEPGMPCGGRGSRIAKPWART